MDDFLRFFDGVSDKRSLRLEITYSSIVDWCITVQRYVDNRWKNIVDVQHCDMEYAFAKAQVELKEWFLENEGGY